LIEQPNQTFLISRAIRNTQHTLFINAEIRHKKEKYMKKSITQSIVLLLIIEATLTAHAAELFDTAIVISSVPVYVQNQPVQQCNNVMVQNGNGNRGGALIGAIAGGLLGNTVGGGNGRNAATAVGAVTGALAGNAINAQPSSQMVCQYVSDGGSHVVGYDVTYQYAGKQATVRMQSNPGSTIRVGIQAM
jgi:uncharacterized protein YcfJ